MGYTFSIEFSGVCVYGPNRLYDRDRPYNHCKDPASSWSVLLPSLSGGAPLELDEYPGGVLNLVPHFPVVEFPRRNLLDDSNQPIRMFYRKPPGGEYGISFLDKERLSIHLPNKGREKRRFDVRDEALPESLRPNLAEGPWTVNWIPGLEELLEGAGEVDARSLFEDNGGLKELAGQIVLNDGSLFTNSFAEPGHRVALWDFRHPLSESTETVARPVAYSIGFMIEQVEGPVELRFDRILGSGIVTSSLFLGPNTESPDIKIRILNREFEEILGFGEKIPTTGSFDIDFEAVYEMTVKAADSQRLIPCHAGVLDGNELGSHRVTCGSSRFLGFSQDYGPSLAKLDSL